MIWGYHYFWNHPYLVGKITFKLFFSWSFGWVSCPFMKPLKGRSLREGMVLGGVSLDSHWSYWTLTDGFGENRHLRHPNTSWGSVFHNPQMPDKNLLRRYFSMSRNEYRSLKLEDGVNPGMLKFVNEIFVCWWTFILNDVFFINQL